jgi:hypothetical protein
MLPSFEECKKRIEVFDSKHANSTFDEFWQYKLEVEKSGSILDSSHLDETAKLLDKKLLSHKDWKLARTGIPSHSKIKGILKNIRPYYEIISHYHLGDGHMSEVRDELNQIFQRLCGITNTLHRDPDEFGEFFIVGKSKVLMFIWGQAPSFDKKVRENFSLWTHAPAPYQLPHIWLDKRRYTPEEFCDIIEELDHWVTAWDTKYKKEKMISFQGLSSNRPIGRIIDIIYWTECDHCKPYDNL